MKLVNGKVNEAATNLAGIGLANVQRRLDLLYKDKYELDINEEEEVFIVNLKMKLEKMDPLIVSSPTPLITEAYA
jgi:sensor histidine kinase YesM